MTEKITTELSSMDIAVLRSSITTFVAKKVYGFIYANVPNGSNSAPSESDVLKHMLETYAPVFKLHTYFKEKMIGTGGYSVLYLEDQIADFYIRCMSNIKWKERPSINIRIRPTPLQEEDIEW